MGKNKQTYTLQIDAEIGNLESKLGSIKNLLSGVLGSANAPKGLDKTFEKLEGLIDRIKAKAAQPIDSKAGFTSITKDVGSTQVALVGLLKTVQSINSLPEADRLSFLPPDAQAQIEKVVNSLANYATAMDAATTETAELATARSELAKAEERVAAAQSRLEQKQASLDGAKAERKAADDAITAIENRKKKLAELREEQKKIEEFYNQPDEKGQKRSRSKKYAGVSARPQDIQKEIKALEEASAGDGAALAHYREELKRTKNDIDSYLSQVSTASRVLRENEATYENLQKKVQELSSAFNSAKPQQQQQAFSALRKEAADLGIELEGIGESYSEADAQELVQRITNLKTKGFDKLVNAADQAEKEIESFGNSCREISDDLEVGTDALEDMNEAASQQKAFENKIKSFLGIQGAAQLMRAALRDAIQTITELDKTMTEMAVVTDLTVGDYWDQLPEYSKQASDLGVSINSAYKAATLYYQQGLKGNEVTKISAETLKMAKIAGLDTADATDKMTAALRGFNMELNETSAQRISDVYSQLAAITAADTKEIANAMTKTASIASSAGMEFETTAAFLSQIIETTRESAETAGTAMKTVIARFQELKKSPDEIGEIDGEIVDANAIETALRSVGVSLRDAGGQFRELDDVFLELSSKWDGLDKNTQRYIATIAAGSRQQSRFIAMMQNYGRTQELVTAANNSAGASQRQFEKTTESLESKVEKLKNAWHEFTMGITNSDLIKFGVDILTKLLEIVNKATEGFEGLSGSILKIGAVFGMFKIGKKLFEKFRAPIVRLFADIIKEAGLAGEKSMQSFKEGAEKQSSVNREKEAPEVVEQPSENPTQKEKKFKQGFGQTREGIGTFLDKKSEFRVESQKLAEMASSQSIGSRKQALMDAEADRAMARQLGATAEELADFDKAIEQAKQSVREYEQQEEKVKGLKQAAVTQTGSGIKTMGGAIVKKLGDVSGVTQISSGLGGQKRKEFLQDPELVQQRREQAQERYDKAAENAYQNPEEYDAAVEELGEACQATTARVEDLNEEQRKAYEEAKKQDYSNVAQGLGQMGQAAVVAGSTMSMLGGVLSSLGLEELGNGLAKAGNAISLFGGLLMTLPSIFSMISAAATAAGITISAALWIVTLIVLAVTAIAATIAIIVSTIQKNSPEAKLKAASEAADKAAESADKVKESYEGLVSALDDLANRQTALENMIRGTDEWNKALQESNAAVLDLIEKYPELANLVENVDGQLKLDTNSDEVRDIIKKYENNSIVARGASISAQKDVSEAKRAVSFSELDAVQKVGNQRGWQAAGGWLGGATGTGAALGAGSLAFLGPIGAGIGAMLGGAAGLITGIIGSSIAGPIKAAGAKTDEELQKATENLAKSVENGETELEFDAMKEFLIEQGVAADEARVMAKTFADDTDALREFGKGVIAAEAANEAYYTAMATNAQQMINLGSYSQDQINQMNEVIDADRMKEIEEEQKKKWQEGADGSDSEEYKQAKEDFATAQYGANARVDGNKIVNEKGETLREFGSDEEFANAIAAAKATEQAAMEMEMVPQMIEAMTNSLYAKANEMGSGLDEAGQATKQALLDGAKAIKQAFTNPKEMTKSELEDFTAIAENDDATKELWASLSKEQKKIYGGDTDEGYANFVQEMKDTSSEVSKMFAKADLNAEKLGITYSSNMSADAAQTWTNTLMKMMPTGANEQNGLNATSTNDALNALLAGMSTEEISATMGAIGAIDITNALEWDKLAYTLEEMGLVTDSTDTALQNFITEAKGAAHAIVKVDFSNFNEQINSTINLLKSAQEGERKYSEEEYKSFVAANSGLKNDFVQVGDEFIYLGDSMSALTDALKENTISQMQQANQVLSAQIGMIDVMENYNAYGKEDENGMLIDYKNADETQLRSFLMGAVDTFAQHEFDVANFGIEGLNLDTDFTKLDAGSMRKMVEQLMSKKGTKETLQERKDKQMRDANVAAYTLNSASFNATKGIEGGEWADEHRDALLAQAAQAGVGEVMLSSYANAAKQYEAGTMSEDTFREISQNLVDMMATIEAEEEKKEEVEALLPLAEKVTAAIEKQRQSEIDKLSDVNDSINSANEALVSKIQEQIDADRQARENEKMKDNLSNLYSQQAYLGMDTSGANALTMLDNNQAIEDAEQEYRDALIDQAIQKLQDANAQAAEQRERQINLLQQQLDYEIENGIIADQATSIVKESIEQVAAGTDISQTQLNDYLREDIQNLGGLQKADAQGTWFELIRDAVQELKPETDDNISGTGDNLELTGDQSGGGDGKTSGLTTDLGSERLNSILESAKTEAAARFSGTGAEREAHKKNLNLYKEEYIKAGGKEADFDNALAVSEDQLSGSIDGVDISNVNSWDRWETATAKFPDGTELDFTFDRKEHAADESTTDALNQIVGGEPEDTWMAMYNGEPYIYFNSKWHYIDNNPDSETDETYAAIKEKYRSYLGSMSKFKTGGLADFTGPAWLDGTKSHPEYVLNSEQTERFFSLVDVLEGYDREAKTSKTSGDNYFDIEINVEKLENDYDVEKVADKIRRMIYDDATYRNVNAINHIR